MLPVKYVRAWAGSSALTFPAPGDVKLLPLPPPPQAVSNSATRQTIPHCLQARFIMSPPSKPVLRTGSRMDVRYTNPGKSA